MTSARDITEIIMRIMFPITNDKKLISLLEDTNRFVLMEAKRCKTLTLVTQ